MKLGISAMFKYSGTKTENWNFISCLVSVLYTRNQAGYLHFFELQLDYLDLFLVLTDVNLCPECRLSITGPWDSWIQWLRLFYSLGSFCCLIWRGYFYPWNISVLVSLFWREKLVCVVCVLSQHAGLNEAQAGIKIARRSITNLRYSDSTTLMAESEEELKRLLKVKEESDEAGLKLNIQKTKITASGPVSSWQIDGETVETVTDYFFGLQNHCKWWLQLWN